jgi:hypothetical protein
MHRNERTISTISKNYKNEGRDGKTGKTTFECHLKIGIRYIKSLVAKENMDHFGISRIYRIYS